MAFTELAAVALIENHYHALVAHSLDLAAVMLLAYCRIQFLNRGDDDFAVAVETLDKFGGIVRMVYRSFLKGFIFFLGLRVEVVAVNNKHNLVNFGKFGHKLCSFERGKGLARACGVPYIAVLRGVVDTLDYLLDRIILIRAQDHQVFVGFVKNDILAYEFAESAFVEKLCGKQSEVVERMVLMSVN